jgi:hypothetical protein
MFGRQFPETAAQTLLRLIGNRNYAPRLPLAPPRQGYTDARAMLVMPCRFHQQSPDQRVACAGDAAMSMLLPLESSPGTSPHRTSASRDATNLTKYSRGVYFCAR